MEVQAGAYGGSLWVDSTHDFRLRAQERREHQRRVADLEDRVHGEEKVIGQVSRVCVGQFRTQTEGCCRANISE